MKITMKFIALILMTLAIATSCTKEGPQGPIGLSGQNGIDGTDGTNGTNGNANVLASEWINIDFGVTSSDLKFISINNPIFTKEIVDNSFILVYGKKFDVTQEDIFMFPYTIGFEHYSYVIFDAVDSYRLRLRAASTDGSDQDFNYFDQVKYFIVPANNITGKTEVEKLTKMSYSELMDHLKLD